MDSKTAPNMPEYLSPPFPPRFAQGTKPGCHSTVATVMTAAVLATGLVAAAIIFRSGGEHAMVTCPPVSSQVAQPMALSANKVKRADLTNGKGDHLTEDFDFDRQSNTVLIDSPANISDNSAATIAVDLDRSVMFMSFHDSNTCIGLAISDEFAHQVKDYVEENDNQVIDISSVPLDIENYRLVGQIPTAYMQATNGPVIRGLCAGRNTFWALPATEEEHERLKREVDCGIFRACVCLFNFCGCRWVIGCFDMDELRADGWDIL